MKRFRMKRRLLMVAFVLAGWDYVRLFFYADGELETQWSVARRLLFFLSVSWVSFAGRGAGEKEVAFAGVAGKGGGAFELGAGFGVAA